MNKNLDRSRLRPRRTNNSMSAQILPMYDTDSIAADSFAEIISATTLSTDPCNASDSATADNPQHSSHTTTDSVIDDITLETKGFELVSDAQTEPLNPPVTKLDHKRKASCSATTTRKRTASTTAKKRSKSLAKASLAAISSFDLKDDSKTLKKQSLINDIDQTAGSTVQVKLTNDIDRSLNSSKLSLDTNSASFGHDDVQHNLDNESSNVMLTEYPQKEFLNSTNVDAELSTATVKVEAHDTTITQAKHTDTATDPDPDPPVEHVIESTATHPVDTKHAIETIVHQTITNSTHIHDSLEKPIAKDKCIETLLSTNTVSKKHTSSSMVTESPLTVESTDSVSKESVITDLHHSNSAIATTTIDSIADTTVCKDSMATSSEKILVNKVMTEAQSITAVHAIPQNYIPNLEPIVSHTSPGKVTTNHNTLAELNQPTSDTIPVENTITLEPKSTTNCNMDTEEVIEEVIAEATLKVAPLQDFENTDTHVCVDESIGIVSVAADTEQITVAYTEDHSHTHDDEHSPMDLDTHSENAESPITCDMTTSSFSNHQVGETIRTLTDSIGKHTEMVESSTTPTSPIKDNISVVSKPAQNMAIASSQRSTDNTQKYLVAEPSFKSKESRSTQNSYVKESNSHKLAETQMAYTFHEVAGKVSKSSTSSPKRKIPVAASRSMHSAITAWLGSDKKAVDERHHITTETQQASVAPQKPAVNTSLSKSPPESTTPTYSPPPLSRSRPTVSKSNQKSNQPVQTKSEVVNRKSLSNTNTYNHSFSALNPYSLELAEMPLKRYSSRDSCSAKESSSINASTCLPTKELSTDLYTTTLSTQPVSSLSSVPVLGQNLQSLEPSYSSYNRTTQYTTKKDVRGQSGRFQRPPSIPTSEPYTAMTKASLQTPANSNIHPSIQHTSEKYANNYSNYEQAHTAMASSGSLFGGYSTSAHTSRSARFPVYGKQHDYNIAHQVGEGTYGKVFKAVCRQTGDVVALKKIYLREDDKGKDKNRSGFPITTIREIEILRSLRHRNIVELKAMISFAEGILQHGSVQYDLSHIKCLTKQLFEGLGYLHANNIVHRDIKGANLLLNSVGELKLADFGLARRIHVDKDSGEAVPGFDYTNRVVTLWYRSPELLLGSTSYGFEVDIWSAGCIFVEFFSKTAIFQGRTEIEQMDAIVRICGSPTVEVWPGVKDLSWHGLLQFAKTSRNVEHYMRKLNMSPMAIDMIDRVLALDPAKRLTVKSVLEHPFFTVESPISCDPWQ
ncbi:hypothetical protein BDEG_20059 [Batrachochytrium dendrobatidis JEL423]|uniref:Protein kinase domain-containing protein n=1 Tax=Batrachochytrium dendrobatidis (strain JEL423) TaxID=403673 RepID=A0A177W7V8_BATDL|nr:hypothetical protein BDEG_20059 [Batrachochytrium dendrobatidis JEL423]